ncbi:MAG TPA: formate dehydrogenase accessory protein FdhE [Methylomirabilota bacterium]|nr:formate dehydrogenase accessory protein FdhE [Methylomirabilota bacterium]
MSPTLAAPTADALAREHPEFRGWLDLLAAAQEEAARPAWTEAVPEAPATTAPRLAGVTLAIDPDVAAAWLGRLCDRAAAHAPALAGGAARLDPLAVLEASVALDTDGSDALAAAAGVPREPLRAILPLVAYPWLERCGAAIAAPAEHPQGWCPLCGAWATLAEARGLEGARRLRCGRCGGDWRAEWLACPFCGTAEHGRLRGLVGEAGDTRAADGCEACGAWVKRVTTLAAAGVAQLRLLDLATVDLDVAALERGWARPGGLGAPLDVRVAPRERRPWWRRS